MSGGRLERTALRWGDVAYSVDPDLIPLAHPDTVLLMPGRAFPLLRDLNRCLYALAWRPLPLLPARIRDDACAGAAYDSAARTIVLATLPSYLRALRASRRLLAICVIRETWRGSPDARALRPDQRFR